MTQRIADGHPRSPGGGKLTVNPTPKFFGVRFERPLRFGDHTREERQQMLRRLNLIRRLGGIQWGWRKSQLRMVNLALIRSVADYASPAWIPWTAKTNVEQLETAQRAVARVITNLVSANPREVVRKEADPPPLAQRLRELTLLHADKWLQLQPNDPRHQIIIDAPLGEN